MGKKKDHSEPLSTFQDTSKTGRTNGDNEKTHTMTFGSLKQASKVFKKLIDSNERDFEIKEATIKDDFCNYGYEITGGIGIGDTHNVKGSGIIDDDMRDAFAIFNVHLAVLDDVFKHSGIEITDIDTMHGHELTQLFHVTGFKIKGGKENECIVLIGTKYVSSAGGRFDLESPKIPLDNLSSYKWYNELKMTADRARDEVALYKEGKYTVVELEEEPALEQKSLFQVSSEGHGTDDDFKAAEVK